MICRLSPAGGNITTDHRGRDYVYDAENVLRSVKNVDDTALSNLFYYADGTLRFATGTGRLYYDGLIGVGAPINQEIAEFTDPWPLGGGDEFLRRRYVRLPGSVDEPFLMVDFTLGGCTNTSYATCEVWAHQNRLGSVVATTNSAGAVIETYQYSPYGESGPEGDAGFPFRFTGQKLDATMGLYYYKARFYDPETGRFLQTDPIGYEDQMNLYAYVGNDPVNVTDPTGEFLQILLGAVVGAAFEAGAQLIENGGDFSKLDGGKIAVSAALGAATGGAFLLARTAVTGTVTVAGKTVATLSKAQRVDAAASAVTLGATEGIVKEGLDAKKDGRTPEL